MGTSVRDGAPRRLTPAPAQSAVQTAFLFATIECAGPLSLGPLRPKVVRARGARGPLTLRLAGTPERWNERNNKQPTSYPFLLVGSN